MRNYRQARHGGQRADRVPAGGPSTSEKILFWASFLTLIAAGIGFSIRGAILGAWGQQFGFTRASWAASPGGGLSASA